MFDAMLMLATGAMALVVFGTLLTAFFVLEHDARLGRTKPDRKKP